MAPNQSKSSQPGGHPSRNHPAGPPSNPYLPGNDAYRKMIDDARRDNPRGNTPVPEWLREWEKKWENINGGGSGSNGGGKPKL